MKNIMLMLIVALLLSVLAGTHVALIEADPYMYVTVQEGETAPPIGTIPPTVLIFSPSNNTEYGPNSVSLVFNISTEDSYSSGISEVYYLASWQPSITHVNPTTANNYNINITSVPEGTHSLTIYAVQNGRVYTRKVADPDNAFLIYHYYLSYKITGSSRTIFIIDATPPKVSILSTQNKAYDAPDVRLDFAVNDSVSALSYVLDGHNNVSIPGNVTLTGLAPGEHNVTVYATDNAGNVGASGTSSFTVAVPELFPTVPVVTASVVAAVAMGAGLLVHFKRRKHQTEMDKPK
jgi:hypothetical protein